MSTKNKGALGANMKAALQQTTALAIADARGSRVFAAHLLEVCRGATEDFIKAQRRAAMIGYVADYLAKPVAPSETHIAAAAVMIDKPVADRTDDDVKALGAARVRWFNVIECTRDIDPTVFPKSEAKGAAKKAQHAKAKATTGAITTTRGPTKRAKGSKAEKGTTTAPDTIKAATRGEAVATVAQMSSAIMAFAEAPQNKKLLGAKNMTQIKKAHALLMSLTTDG